MATTVFLVRHAAHDRVDAMLCGRMPGVGLGELGRHQAVLLAERLHCAGVQAVHTSPLRRARETAEPLAARLGALLHVEHGVTEIDFGDWTGCSFEALGSDPRWLHWNEARAAARPPNGESMVEAQSRAVDAVERLRDAHPNGRVAVVSHGDVIKSVLSAFLGLSLDHHHRFDISPASFSTLSLWPGGGRVLDMNGTITA